MSTLDRTVVGSGCILNQFAEKVRCATECTVIDVDKKQLKKLCMLLRWKCFGQGVSSSAVVPRSSSVETITSKRVDTQGFAGLQVCVNDFEGVKPLG